MKEKTPLVVVIDGQGGMIGLYRKLVIRNRIKQELPELRSDFFFFL